MSQIGAIVRVMRAFESGLTLTPSLAHTVRIDTVRQIVFETRNGGIGNPIFWYYTPNSGGYRAQIGGSAGCQSPRTDAIDEQGRSRHTWR